MKVRRLRELLEQVPGEYEVKVHCSDGQELITESLAPLVTVIDMLGIARLSTQKAEEAKFRTAFAGGGK